MGPLILSRATCDNRQMDKGPLCGDGTGRGMQNAVAFWKKKIEVFFGGPGILFTVNNGTLFKLIFLWGEIVNS